MKKLLLSAVFAAAALLSQAQCIVNPGLTAPGFYPDSLTGIPGATVGVPYSTDIQIRVPQDTVLFGFTIPIDSMVINSIANIPPGFIFTSNPISGTIPGNGNGCMLISGTATPGQETGGLLSDGVYNLLINYTLYATVPFVGSQSLPQVNVDYRLVVTNPVGIKTNSAGKAIKMYPNPVSDVLTLETAAGEYRMDLFDYTGRLILSQQGTNTGKLALSTENVQTGNYYLVLKTDGKTITEKITVLH